MSAITSTSVTYFFKAQENGKTVNYRVKEDRLKELAQAIQSKEELTEKGNYLATRTIYLITAQKKVAMLGRIADPVYMDFKRLRLTSFGRGLLPPKEASQEPAEIELGKLSK
ncbi:MAG: hypothetical protein PVI40_00170 [Chlamydiota bacterium]|jgi:hypothetical protein